MSIVSGTLNWVLWDWEKDWVSATSVSCRTCECEVFVNDGARIIKTCTFSKWIFWKIPSLILVKSNFKLILTLIHLYNLNISREVSHCLELSKQKTKKPKLNSAIRTLPPKLKTIISYSNQDITTLSFDAVLQTSLSTLNKFGSSFLWKIWNML